MNRCFFISKGWKSNIKTVYWLMSLLYFIFLFPGLAAALQTAFIRASDDKVYQIHYKNPLNVENFLVQSSNGRTVPRNVIAELYLAAEILNRPPTASDIYEDNELWRLVHDECLNTAKWKGYHEIATIVGSKSMNLLVGLATGSIEVMKVSLEAITGEGP